MCHSNHLPFFLVKLEGVSIRCEMKAIGTDSDKMSNLVVSHVVLDCLAETVLRHTWVEPRSLVRHYIDYN